MELEPLLRELVSTLKTVQIQQANLTSQVRTSEHEHSQIDTRGISLQPYDEINESFEAYLQRLQNYLELRNLTDDTPENDKKSVQILINCLGPKTYQVLSSLTAPDLPNTKKYKDLITLLRSHLCPKPSEVAEQHKFSMRMQQEGESIATYQAELKRLTTNCNFVCETCKKPTINTHLRAQFIRGVRCNETREKLLQQGQTISFEEAVTTALAIEAAKAESKEMQKPQNMHKISRLSNIRPGPSKQNFPKKKPYNGSSKARTQIHCFRCGKVNHNANECGVKNLKCTFCGKQGHLSTVCFKKRQQNTENANIIEILTSDGEDCYAINSVTQSKQNYSDKF